MDEGLLDGPSAMQKFLNFVSTEPDVARVCLGFIEMLVLMTL